MHQPLLDRSNVLFDKSFTGGGPRHSRVQWDDANRQYLRFAEIYRSIPSHQCSILDIGCGNGEFLLFLNYMGFTGSYTGVDIHEPLLQEARATYPGYEFLHRDMLTQHIEQHDIVIMSGVFNLNIGQDMDFVKSFISKMYDLCKFKTIFNAISTHVNLQEETMYYIDPAEIMNFAIQTLSPKVELRHGYLPFNFTVAIEKSPVWCSLPRTNQADSQG
ncbi:hypothetical protein NNJEOMEG_02695 [Fundidesulfovibrio magnetotacticus]|uniref:Methyltransferase domain-containing protein n=1 Tax=Fundidesulfovibrio magnetotacticus TaxID=2730080 RepID=A0A6V8LYX4_9BACT|nr:class I SAM-dependent methyltransferase [Fundidesulfovibrio magnetotacticus]GFK94847.1 hypothetical protein NNJEOMEG_02695 [Fundidesulfovibrio magnetotacticus]